MSTDDARPLTRRELRERDARRAAAPGPEAAPGTDLPPEAAAGADLPLEAAASAKPSRRTPFVTPGRAPEPAPPSRPSRRRFLTALLGVVGLLTVLVGVGAAVSLTQGPRVSEVQVDPAAAIASSGTRLVLTANQSLADIDPARVTVTPEAPFTVDAAGRMVGIRFTVPLDDDTEYTVTIDGVSGVGGGPAATLETSFATPAAEIFLLQRDPDGDDTIFRTGLSGEEAVPVYTADAIDDFRVTSTRLVVSEQQGEASALFVADRDGGGREQLPLPGEGRVTGLQVSDRGDLVGYTYSDLELSASSGRASVLFTASLRDASAEPEPMTVAGEEPSIASWRFVPDSSALLFVDFDGDLILFDAEAEGAEPSLLGTAMSIDAVTRGTYTAFVERLDAPGSIQLDLTTGESADLVAPADDLGQAGRVLPVPGGGTTREFVQYGDDGRPSAQVVAYVDDEGASTPLFTAEGADGLLQTCVSPSGRYVAALVAPDLTTNRYDYGALQPLPLTVQTHIVDIASGEEVSALNGFGIDWCQVGPWDGAF